MADKQLSALTAAAALADADLLYVSQGGNSRKATAAQVKTYAGGLIGALVKKAADQTAANYTSSTNVAWDAEGYDTHAFHDNATNNSRLTVPAGQGFTYAQVTVNLRIQSLTSDVFAFVGINKNGSSSFDGAAGSICDISNTNVNLCAATPWVSVTDGDYFEAALIVQTDTSIDIIAARSSFAIVCR